MPVRFGKWMEEVFSISVSKDTRISMVKTAREEIDRALSRIEPLFDEDKDIIKLRNCLPESDHIRLTYEILRDARRSKAEENRSPYRENGFSMRSG